MIGQSQRCEAPNCGCRRFHGTVLVCRGEVHTRCPNVIAAPTAAMTIRSHYSSAGTGLVSPQAAALIASRSRADTRLDAASLVRSGDLVLIRGSSRAAGSAFKGSVLTSTAAAEAAAAPAAKKLTTWIRFKVVDDATSAAIPGVVLIVRDTRGKEGEYTTRADGTVELSDIDPGVCSASGRRDGARLTDTLGFVAMGPAIGGGGAAGGPPPSGTRILLVEEHKVQSGETIDSLARGIGMSWQDLSIFNWGTSVPTEINNHLRDEVGCTKKTADGYNYIFTSEDDPGIMFLPHDWTQDGLATEQEHVIRVKALGFGPSLVFVLVSKDTGHVLPDHRYRVKDLDGTEITTGTTADRGEGSARVPRSGTYLVEPIMEGAFTVSGVAYMRNDRRPLENADLEVLPSIGDSYRTKTAGDGSVRLSDVPPGQLTLRHDSGEFAMYVEQDRADVFMFFPHFEEGEAGEDEANDYDPADEEYQATSQHTPLSAADY